MKRVRFPEDQASLCEWLKRKKKRGEEPSKVWKEWWTLNKAIKRSGVEKLLPQPFVAEHADTYGNGADFEITFADRTVLALEITEATTTEDRKEIVRNRRATEVMPLGSHGGRFAGGAQGDAYELRMASDINDAVARKSNKRYGSNSALLIYPNSNAWPADMDALAGYLRPLAEDSPFLFALVVRERSLIAITKDVVSLISQSVPALN